MGSNFNETNNIYGIWKVLGRVKKKNEKVASHAYWLCECQICKHQQVYAGATLRAGAYAKECSQNNHMDNVQNYELLESEQLKEDKIILSQNNIVEQQVLLNQDTCGLYLLAMIFSPLNNFKDQKYAIKIGQSIDINRRLASYKTTNPFLNLVEIKTIDLNDIPDDIFQDCSIINQIIKNRLNIQEKKYHDMLNIIGTCIKDTEWYEVTQDIFLSIAEKGFNYFV